MSKSRAFLEQLGSKIDESLGQRKSPLAEVVEHPSRAAKYEGRTRAKDIAEIALDKIDVDPQHREHFDDADLTSLSEDLKAHGLIQPIVVRWDSKRRCYIIIAGERRFRAAQLAGWSRIECKVKPDDISHGEIAEIQLSENFARKNLNPIELAQAFQDVLNKNNWPARELAKRLGVDETTVTRQLRFLKLPEDVQGLIASGKLSKTAAREIARLNSEQTQRKLVAQSLAKTMTTNEVARVVASQTSPKRRRRQRPKRRFQFEAEHGRVSIEPSASKRATYDHIESVLVQA